MKRFVFVMVASALCSPSLRAAAFSEVAELGALFNKHEITGTFVLLDPVAHSVFVWNEARARERFSPGATFRIANSLIALDAGVVKDVDEVIVYNGVSYSMTIGEVRPYIYGARPPHSEDNKRDLSMRRAFRTSLSTYRTLARRVGLEGMRAGVTKLRYGNMEVGDTVDRFWTNGTLRISAIEQAEFLARFLHGELPVSPQAIRAVREISLTEKSTKSELHSKSGWITTEPQIGWWVGWVEQGEQVYPFALNLDIRHSRHVEQRALVGRECLKILGKL